jgi:hypothetical protein
MNSAITKDGRIFDVVAFTSTSGAVVVFDLRGNMLSCHPVSEYGYLWFDEMT